MLSSSCGCDCQLQDFKDGAEFYEYLYENFPWMPWRDALEKDLAESFATHAGQCTGPVSCRSLISSALLFVHILAHGLRCWQFENRDGGDIYV